MVKVTFDVDKDKVELVQSLVDFLYNNDKSGSKQTNLDDGLVCSSCSKKVKQNVADFSKKKFDKILCYECQKKEE